MQKKKKRIFGTSLVVQRYDSTLPMQGAQVRPLVKDLDPACCN